MLEFKARKWKDHCVVSYECDCGCRPMAHYYEGSAEAAHEHCCCGKVHFAGPQAKVQLEEYLVQRRQEGLDEGLAYVLDATEVKAPWGEPLPVAYALPYVEGETPPPTPAHRPTR